MALHNNPEYLAALVKNVSEAIISTDLNLLIQSWNPGATQIYGYKEEEVVGKHLGEFLKTEYLDETEMEEAVHALFSNGFWKGMVIQYHRNGRKIPILSSVSLIKNLAGENVGMVAVNRDISETHDAEIKLREAKEILEKEVQNRTAELLRSNRDLERFAFLASHDLQEPLRMIISFLQILKKKTAEKLSEEENEFLSFAEDGAKRLKYQLDALLEYSRVSRHPLKKVLVKPAGLLENVRQDLKHLLEESGGEMHWKEMPEIAADPVLLERVFHNLIRNALIFTVAGKPEINISATPGKEGMVFKVSDNGIGIPEEFHDKVFEMFQRLHPPGRFPGSGIGLAVSRGIIERHKGKIWVNSAPGKGSTFHFLLPNRSLT